MTSDFIKLRMPSDPEEGKPHQDWHKKSLWHKLSDSYHERHHDPIASGYANLASIVFFWFTVVSELYVTLVHIIPERYADYDDMTRYYLKVFACFVTVQTAANWLCVRYFDSVPRTSDSVSGDRRLYRTGNSIQTNGNNPTNNDAYRKEDKLFMQTKHCDICNIDQPYRAHHCILCKKCILKRDHHCYMTGVCIGYFNQRYFIVMNFYIAIGSLWGLYEISLYMLDTFVADSDRWDYFFPVTWFRWLLGAISFHHMLMIAHLYTLWWTGFTSAAFVIWNAFIILLGRTSHEVHKYVKVRSSATLSQRIQSVFGAFWPVNFIFPAVLVFKQEGDGTDWSELRMN